MNKQEILKRAKEYEKAQTLRNCATSILSIGSGLTTQSLYYFSNLPKEARKEVADIFKREAERIENG